MHTEHLRRHRRRLHPNPNPNPNPNQSTCAVIGGVFTVFGMLVALLDTSSEAFSKKSI